MVSEARHRLRLPADDRDRGQARGPTDGAGQHDPVDRHGAGLFVGRKAGEMRIVN